MPARQQSSPNRPPRPRRLPLFDVPLTERVLEAVASRALLSRASLAALGEQEASLLARLDAFILSAMDGFADGPALNGRPARRTAATPAALLTTDELPFPTHDLLFDGIEVRAVEH